MGGARGIRWQGSGSEGKSAAERGQSRCAEDLVNTTRRLEGLRLIGLPDDREELDRTASGEGKEEGRKSLSCGSMEIDEVKNTRRGFVEKGG